MVTQASDQSQNPSRAKIRECERHEPLTKHELEAVHLSAQSSRPLGDEGWVEGIARRLTLEFTMRPKTS